MGIVQFEPPCGFSKNMSSKKRVKHLNIIISHIFSEFFWNSSICEIDTPKIKPLLKSPVLLGLRTPLVFYRAPPMATFDQYSAHAHAVLKIVSWLMSFMRTSFMSFTGIHAKLWKSSTPFLQRQSGYWICYLFLSLPSKLCKSKKDPC